MSTGFGARPDGGAFHYRQEQDIQALKLRLHRYIIDEIDEDGMNLLEGARSAVVQYVSEKVCEYGSRHQLAISRYELDRLAEEVVDELTGFGPLEILLRDPGVSEILVNGPGRVFVEREGRLYQSDLRFIDDHHVLRVIQRILAPLGRRLDESSPMVDARLPDGSRVNAIIPPVALDGPCISIRKFSQELLRSADLLAYQSVDDALLEFLRQAVSRRCNILISGGTGTGKTTLLNVISGFIDERERIVTIEDTAELQLGHDHVVRLETRPPNAEGYGEVTARDLIRNALRMRPDRIILGEIRGVEVLDVLQAMNTGHDGSMSTVHANSAMDSLLRMEMLVGLTGNRLPEQTLRLMICAALDVVVQITRLASGRRCISEVLEVLEVRDGVYVTNTLFSLDRRGSGQFVRQAAPVGQKSPPGAAVNGAQLLVLFSGVLAFAALALAFMGWRAGRNELVVERLLGRQEAVAVRPRSSHWLARQMRRAGIQRPRPWLFGAAVLALLLVWSGLRLFGIVGALGGLLLAALSCRVALGMLYQRRLKRMIRQMPRFLDQVVRSLHAGRTLGDALMQAVENAEEPLRDIFTLARNHVLGIHLPEALQEVAELYEVEELRILALGVSVNHRYGGNTSDLLDSIVKLIHEREKLSRQLHAMTGETRISAYVLAGVPSALGGYILASNPGYLLNMWADGTGRFLLLASLGLQLLGCYALWRMLKSV